ncbi:MAG: substrate-binding domain-containing protein [Phycisphaerae bacterium]
MRRLAFLLILLLANVAMAVDTAPATQPADPMAESRRIDEAVKELWSSTPGSKAIDEINAKLGQLREREAKESRALYNQLQSLQNTDAYRAYTQKSRELEAQRQDAWKIERNTMAAAAKRLYAARHEELRTLVAAIPNGKTLGFDVLSFPRLDGSTSTYPLNRIVAARLLNVSYEWLYPEPTGSPWHEYTHVPDGFFLPAPADRYPAENYEFDLAAAQVVAKPNPGGTPPPAQQRIAVMINSLLAANTTTHDAYVNLIEGRCDLNINARPPSASERKLAQDKGVKIVLKPIARDALVFIVHRSNPVQTLTTGQLREIYQGKFKQWREVIPDSKAVEQWKSRNSDEGNKAILALRRESESGSRELFDALLMQGQVIPEVEGRWARQLYSNSMSGPYNQVTESPTGLGYSVYYYEHFMALSAYTRTLAVDGVEPTAATIASGRYPLVAPVYAAYREGDPSDSPGMKLLAWLLSPEGQAIVRESGYVPVK